MLAIGEINSCRTSYPACAKNHEPTDFSLIGLPWKWKLELETMEVIELVVFKACNVCEGPSMSKQ